MLIRPFRYRQVRVGAQPLPPDPQQVISAVEAEVETLGQVIVVIVQLLLALRAFRPRKGPLDLCVSLSRNRSSSCKRDPEVGEGVELFADMGFQHLCMIAVSIVTNAPDCRSTSAMICAAISAATRPGQVTQTSRLRRARRNTSVSARARSTSVPFFFNGQLAYSELQVRFSSHKVQEDI